MSLVLHSDPRLAWILRHGWTSPWMLGPDPKLVWFASVGLTLAGSSGLKESQLPSVCVP